MRAINEILFQVRLPGRNGWCLKSIATDFPEDEQRALIFDLCSQAKLVYPWPGSSDDASSDPVYDVEKATILLLCGFTPRPGQPAFSYKVVRETEVIFKL
jgi:hypothetical protein